jgi:hypothetical protein
MFAGLAASMDAQLRHTAKFYRLHEASALRQDRMEEALRQSNLTTDGQFLRVESAILELTRMYKEAVSALQQQHEEAVSALQQQHEEAVSALQQQHEEAVSALQQQHEEAVSAWQRKYDELSEELHSRKRRREDDRDKQED